MFETNITGHKTTHVYNLLSDEKAQNIQSVKIDLQGQMISDPATNRAMLLQKLYGGSTLFDQKIAVATLLYITQQPNTTSELSFKDAVLQATPEDLKQLIDQLTPEVEGVYGEGLASLTQTTQPETTAD
jgi:hypothetical protein